MTLADIIPSTPALKAQEKTHVRNSLKLNGYTDNFIDKACEPKRNTTPLTDSANQRGTVILPYSQDVADQLIL